MEQTLKAHWLPILSARPQIRRAFLVKASYEGPDDIHVVLVLCSTRAADGGLVEELRVPYSAIFSRDCPLDMMFANSAQEAELEKLCRSFYASV